MKLEPAVTQAAVTVWVGKGGEKPSPTTLVTMGMGFTVDPAKVMVVEMTVGQTKNLIRMLTDAAGATELWKSVRIPEVIWRGREVDPDLRRSGNCG